MLSLVRLIRIRRPAAIGHKQPLVWDRYLPIAVARKGRLSVADNNSKVPHEPKDDSITVGLETELVMDTELGFLTQRDGPLNRSCHDDFACLATPFASIECP